LSLIIFGFLGGISGVMMGTEQLNLIIHNTVYVPGHFHATVATGTTLAFMAITYWLVPILFRREVIMKPLAALQPYIFGIGMSGVSIFLMGAGTLGVPRRHWDMAFSGALMSHDFPATAFTMMGLAGVSVVLACVGGALFCLIVVGSLLLGKRKGEERSATPMIAEPVADYHGIGIGKIAVPGTLTLALVFLTSFVLYYFVNWKYLAQTWGLS
ncbi:MAG: cbb3-type cytochrome c oxidase subunit I, partial [Gammaproteobacteria bacterium]|nr:cbb3-type cytochrome c oxidase subunit I [Gammaproteobacteria bacterium]